MVVIKMILPQYSQDARFQEMFLDEARIASRIEHSNVARILDVGEHEGNYFMVMEWVDGDSLSKVFRAAEQRGQRVPTGVALRVCADAAAGLHAAHELKDRDGSLLGVIHRDVSPQNILIANTGATMLIDFGVAKARDRVSQETSAGQLKGKIRYMAPEQALGRSIDRRADVWALGAILYELVTGSPPYDGPNEVATLHKLTSGAPPAPVPPDVPEPVRAVLERALAYDPESRYATALELNLALEGAMVELGDPTSIAVVAHYTAQLLAERKAARRRAVETALQTSRAREPGASSSSLALGTPGVPLPPPGSSHARVPTPPASGDVASAPSQANHPMGLAEVPSATSSATLGSAAMEYPPMFGDPAARRRRQLGTIVLGVSLTAGAIGAVLIVSSAMRRREASQAAGELAASAALAAPPPEAPSEPAPSEPTVAVSSSATPTKATSAPSNAAAVTAAPSPPAPAAAPPAPKPQTTAAPSHHVRTTAPAPAPPRPAKPAPATPTTSKKDYGF